jgi:hypothetical protein
VSALMHDTARRGPVGHRLPQHVSVLAILLCGVLAASACASAGGSRAASPGLSPLPHNSIDYRNYPQVEAKVDAAILSRTQLPSWVTRNLNGVERNGLQQACNARLPSDAHLLAAKGDTWLGKADVPIIDQYVIGYDTPLADEAVKEADQGSTCKSYRWKDFSIRLDGRFAPASASGAAGAVTFCERVKPDRGGREVSVCTAIWGRGSIACSVRAWDSDRSGAIAVLEPLLSAMGKSCIG